MTRQDLLDALLLERHNGRGWRDQPDHAAGPRRLAEADAEARVYAQGRRGDVSSRRPPGPHERSAQSWHG